MSENSMKGTLIKRASKLDAVAIESPMTGLGIPDVNYICGWIECKALPKWPVNCDTRPVKFPHPWTKEQQVWGYRREKAGGICLVCVKVSDTWFFFSATTLKVNKLWDNMTRPQMHECALKVFERSLPQKELCDFLISPYPPSHWANTF